MGGYSTTQMKLSFWRNKNWAAGTEQRWVLYNKIMQRFNLKWYVRNDSTCQLACFLWCLIGFSSLQHHRTLSLAMPTLPLKHDILPRVLWAFQIVIVGAPWWICLQSCPQWDNIWGPGLNLQQLHVWIWSGCWCVWCKHETIWILQEWLHLGCQSGEWRAR